MKNEIEVKNASRYERRILLEEKRELLEYLDSVYKKLDTYDREVLSVNSLEDLLGTLKTNIENLKKDLEMKK